jgi:asparagine synthetase B (glutamine-hydrolysing)
MLDGNGGDEVFAASPYLLADLMRRGRLLSAARLARRIPGAGTGRRDAAESLLEWGVRGLLPGWLDRRSESEPPLLNHQGQRWFRAGRESATWRRRRGPSWWASKAHQLTRGAEALGANDHRRRAVESAGIVSRHPLLDPELVDFMLSLPPEWSFDPTFTRPLLREAGKGLLPDEIRMRWKKAEFGRVFADPLEQTDLPLLRNLLGSAKSECFRYLDRSVVERELLAGPDRNPRGRIAWALEIWRVANVELWLRMQSDSAPPLGLGDQTGGAEEGHWHFLHP